MKKIKIKLLTAFILVLCILNTSIAADAKQKIKPYKDFKPFKMVFLPDVQLSFDTEDSMMLHKESLVIFQDIIRQLNNEEQLNFIVFGGDLTENKDGQLSDLPMFIDNIIELQPQYYAILGDNDANFEKNLSKSDFTKEFGCFNLTNNEQTFWKAEPIENILLIGLDTTVTNRKAGYLNLHQLMWLDNTLQNNSEKFTIITMHHPAVSSTEIDETMWKNYTLQKPEIFLNIINKYPQVKMIFNGNHYNNRISNYNKKLFISAPSIISYPNEYKVFEVSPDKINIKTNAISFKQIIKKAKQNLIKSDYAKEYNPQKPKKIINFQKGDKFSQQKVIYFDKL